MHLYIIFKHINTLLSLKAPKKIPTQVTTEDKTTDNTQQNSYMQVKL